MEEMDMVKRARQYLEALSTGMDPISKKQVPPGDTLLQPRLSRCFRYVSELLKGIEKDPALLKRLADARPSHETKGNEKAYPYGAASSARMQEENKLSAPGSAENRKDGRLSLSKITENLRPLLGENPEMTLETSEITEWLLLSGYLCHITRETDGAHRIVPTEKVKNWVLPGWNAPGRMESCIISTCIPRPLRTLSGSIWRIYFPNLPNAFFLKARTAIPSNTAWKTNGECRSISSFFTCIVFLYKKSAFPNQGKADFYFIHSNVK